MIGVCGEQRGDGYRCWLTFWTPRVWSPLPGGKYHRLASRNCDAPLKVDTLSQQTLPEGTKWQDWRDRKGELFQAVRMEKNMMGLLLEPDRGRCRV